MREKLRTVLSAEPLAMTSARAGAGGREGSSPASSLSQGSSLESRTGRAGKRAAFRADRPAWPGRDVCCTARDQANFAGLVLGGGGGGR